MLKFKQFYFPFSEKSSTMNLDRRYLNHVYSNYFCN